MLGNKYILIGAGTFLIIVGIFVFILNNRSASPNGPLPTPPTTGTGGVGTQPPLTTTTGRCGTKGYCVPPQVFSDPSQPFAINLPRTTEPEKNNTSVAPQAGSTTPIQGGSATPSVSSASAAQQQQLINDGIIPRSDGEYVQTVDPSGWNKSMVSQYDYSLSDTAFLAKYYPDYQSVLNHTTAGDQQLNAADPILLAPAGSSGGSTQLAATTNTVSGMSSGMFNVSSATDAISMQQYIKKVSDQTASFDIVHDATLISSVLNNLSTGDFSLIPGQLASSQDILNKLKSDSVPRPMLGLHETYYDLYTKYVQFLSDSSAAQNVRTTSQLEPALTKIQQDATIFTSALDTVRTNINIATNIIGAS